MKNSFAIYVFDWLTGPLTQLLQDIRTEQASQGEQIVTIQLNQESMMATQQETTAAVERLNLATSKSAAAISAVGTRIQALEDKIKGMGLDATQEAELLAALSNVAGNIESNADALEQMGKDPSNPVPVEPPPPVEPTPEEPV